MARAGRVVAPDHVIRPWVNGDQLILRLYGDQNAAGAGVVDRVPCLPPKRNRGHYLVRPAVDHELPAAGLVRHVNLLLVRRVRQPSGNPMGPTCATICSVVSFTMATWWSPVAEA